MNEKFIQLYETSGLSLYELAKKTGLSYTTVNELKRAVLDINRCSVQHVCKLAELFCVPIEELMNPCSYMEGVRGEYRKIRYVWKKKETMVLTFTYKNQPVELDSGLKMTVAGRREAYILAGELMIDRFLQKKAFAEKADRWIEDAGACQKENNSERRSAAVTCRDGSSLSGIWSSPGEGSLCE